MKKRITIAVVAVLVAAVLFGTVAFAVNRYTTKADKVTVNDGLTTYTIDPKRIEAEFPDVVKDEHFTVSINPSGTDDTITLYSAE